MNKSIFSLVKHNYNYVIESLDNDQQKLVNYYSAFSDYFTLCPADSSQHNTW